MEIKAASACVLGLNTPKYDISADLDLKSASVLKSLESDKSQQEDIRFKELSSAIFKLDVPRQRRWGKKEDRQAFAALNRLLKSHSMTQTEFFSEVRYFSELSIERYLAIKLVHKLTLI